MLCKYFTKYKYRRKKIVEKNQKCRQLYRSVTIINFATERKRLFFFFMRIYYFIKLQSRRRIKEIVL